MEYKDKCPYCNSENIIETDLFGDRCMTVVTYADTLFSKKEFIHASVCLNCGSIIRLFVKEPKRLVRRKKR